MVAAEGGHVETVVVLIEHGADVNLKDCELLELVYALIYLVCNTG